MKEPQMPTPEVATKIREDQEALEKEEKEHRKAGGTPEELYANRQFDPETGEDIGEFGREC
jgi:hypothetical protein